MIIIMYLIHLILLITHLIMGYGYDITFWSYMIIANIYIAAQFVVNAIREIKK